ncbi:Damage-control phosphatase-like protein [Drosera capensis]
MGRGIETNLYAQFKCDSIKIGMDTTEQVQLNILNTAIDEYPNHMECVPWHYQASLSIADQPVKILTTDAK